MTNLKAEREAIVSEAVKSVTRDDDGLLDIGKNDHELLADLLNEALLSHEEKVVARVLTQIARIPKMEFKMSDVQEALTLPITDESV